MSENFLFVNPRNEGGKFLTKFTNKFTKYLNFTTPVSPSARGFTLCFKIPHILL